MKLLISVKGCDLYTTTPDGTKNNMLTEELRIHAVNVLLKELVKG